MLWYVSYKSNVVFSFTFVTWHSAVRLIICSEIFDNKNLNVSLFIPAAKIHIVELEMHINSTILLFQENERIALHNADNKIS